MMVLAWLRWPGRPSSLPEPCSSGSPASTRLPGREGVRRLRRGLLAALLCLPLLAGAAPGAAAQSVSLCGSPTPVPSDSDPPVNIADAIVFDFTSNSFGIWTNEAGEATVTVARTGARAASVDYETGNGTLAAPGGYTHTAGTLRFAEGETSRSFTVPVSGAPGFFRVFLSNASDGGGVCPGSARPWGSTVRVHPARPAGLILLPAGSLTVTEGGSASYTVRLNSRPAGGDVTVTVGGASGTDVTVDTDGGMAGDQNTLTFTTSNWHRPRTVILRAREDTDGAWDRVTLTHTASGADYGSVAGALVVTVKDNDGNTPLIEFTRDTIDTGEGAVAVVRVRKLGGGAATVDYATADGTATAPADYTAASGTLSFASGETEKTVTVAIVDDGAADGDENFTVTLSNPSGASLGPNRVATVRIKQPDFEFTSANYYVQENQGPAVISVRKIGAGVGEVEYLTIARGHPFAEPPDDRPIVEGTLTFAAGDTVKSFTVPIVDDGVGEPDELFGVALRIRPILLQPGKNLAYVTIRNHPPVPLIEFKSVVKSVREDEGAVTVTITKIGAGAATVDYETAEFDPGTATASADYTPVSGTLSFASGETEKTVTVPIVNDNVDEPIEHFYVSLTNPSGGFFDPRSLGFPETNIIVIAVNDDDPVVIGFASGVHAVHEGEGTATLTVTKTGATVRGVAVRYATADDTAEAPGDYTDTSGTLTFGPSETEKTIDIPLTNDNVAEDPEFFSVTLSNPTHATLDSDKNPARVIVTDDAAPPSRQVATTPPAVTISADRTSVTEGGDVTFTVTADPAPAGDLVVTVAADEEMGAGNDRVGGGHLGTVTIRAETASATWTLTTMSDNDDLADGTVTGRIAAGDGYTVGEPSSVALALLDDDGPVPQDVPDSVVGDPATPAIDPALIAEVRALAGQTHHGTAHVNRWRRVLVAFGVETYQGLSPTTAAEAQANAKRYSNPLWPRIATVLTELEAAAALAQQQQQEQQPATVPEITVSAGDAVTEGGDAVFTVTANPAPASPLSVSVTVAAQGEYGIAVGERPVTIPTTGSATLTLATTGDNADEPDGSATVTVKTGDGYTVGDPASGSVSIADDDLPPPAVSIRAKTASVTEGGAAAFTLTADRAPDADLTVTLSVAETGDGDHVAAADEGPATATIAKGATEALFSVATVDDDASEPDGSVTVTLKDGEGYTVPSPPGNAATVTVSDDDAAVGPLLSVDDATGQENGRLPVMPFTVRLSAPSQAPVRVHVSTRPSTPVSATPKVDYAPGSYNLLFRAGETEKQVWIWIHNDSHDEEPETFEVVLSDARGAPVGDGVAVGTIVNDDPMPAAWLARFGRTVAEQALDGIAGRMSAPRTPGMQGAIAGQALSFDPAAKDNGSAAPAHAPDGAAVPGGTGSLALADVARAFGGQSDQSGPGGLGHDAAGFGNGTQSRTMTARDALLGSSFSLTGAADGSGGSMAFWGRAAQGSFDGREGTFSLDGAVTTGMLGADYARGKWLVGLALAQSEGEGDYRDSDVSPRPDGQSCPDGVDSGLCSGAVRAGDGSVEASLTAAIPYAALQASERLKLWGAAGYGTGEVTLKTALGGSYRADTTWSMAAAGLRGDLLAPPAPGSGSGAGSGSGPALAVTSDALWTRTSSEKTRDLAASDSDVTRLRLGLEGSYRMALEGGGHLTPKLEVGARHDGGDAETGFGVEIGGGIAWSDPALGLSLDVSGRTLIAHGNDDLKDRGYAASLAFDPDPATQRGPSLSLRQEFGGQAQGGLDALFQPATLEDRTGGSEAASRWAMEAAYGFPAFGGRWTGSPHVGLGLATATRDYSLGWRLTPAAPSTGSGQANANAPDLSFGLRATRRESGAQAAEHTVEVNITARW